MKRLHRGGTASLPVSIRLGPNPHWLWSGRRRCPISKGFRKGQRAGEGAREWGQGKGPTQRPKALPTGPPSGVRHALAVPTQTGAARHQCANAQTFRRKLMRPEPAASLLATPRRQKLLEHIWQRTSLSRRQFATLYLAPLERYAELVQQFRRPITTPIRAACWTTAWRSSPTRSSCGSRICCPPAPRRSRPGRGLDGRHRRGAAA